MTSKFKMLGIIFIIILLQTDFSGINAQPGDCNGDGYVNSSDAVYIINYLFNNGPGPVNYSDCDCDGFQGVNYGDPIQILYKIFLTGTLFPYPGSDYPQASQVKLFFNQQVDFSAIPAVNTLQIYIDVPTGFDIYNFILPFSFLAETGQTNISVSNIDFTGTVGNPGLICSSIYNAEEMFVLNDCVAIYTPSFLGGSSGLLCTVTFTQDGPTANPNDLRLCTRAPALWPMLFARSDYNGTDGIRVFLPEFIRAPYGDGNTDQTVNVSDAVYIINYVFLGGPEPGNKEP
jgi:hypothetical protein